jgi:hypothetical protein
MYIQDIVVNYDPDVSGDPKGKVNHPQLYFHFLHTPRKQDKKERKAQSRQMCVATDLLKRSKCRTVCVGHFPITVNICKYTSEQYNWMSVSQHNAAYYWA